MKKKLRKEVKESLVTTMFGMLIGIMIIGSLVIGNYRYDQFTKKSTDVVPVQAVQDINS